MTIEYDGTNFVGWQIQKNGRSVQEEIERALQKITQLPLRIVGGGRTDAGVHALGQVASFKCENELDCTKMRKGLNGVLPHDVVIRDFEKAEDNFHARYSAKSRVYQYTISSRPLAIGHLYAWELFSILNKEVLCQCAELLYGQHSFEGFCKVGSEVSHFECIVDYANWNFENELMRFTIRANRFLHGMVRAIVGTMVEVGKQKMSIDAFQTILVDGKKHHTTKFAPSKGLCLLEILY